MTEPRITAASIETEPLCVDRAGLAVLLGVSVRQVDRLDSGAKLPAALTLGRCKRWYVEEVKAWISCANLSGQPSPCGSASPCGGYQIMRTSVTLTRPTA